MELSICCTTTKKEARKRQHFCAGSMANGNAINLGQFDADASCGCPCASCQCNVGCALSICVCLSVCGCLCGVSEIYSQQFFAYFSIVFNWQRAEFTGPTCSETITDGQRQAERLLRQAETATKYLFPSLSLTPFLSFGLICLPCILIDLRSATRDGLCGGGRCGLWLEKG